MPLYEYRCEKGHVFEVMQRMSDDPVTACEQCGAPVQRVFHPVAVHFKGSGFYTTDYGKKKAPAGGDSTDKKDSDGAKKESKPDSGSSSSDTSKSGSASSAD
jgi:putative FmdB family regulatory protein